MLWLCVFYCDHSSPWGCLYLYVRDVAAQDLYNNAVRASSDPNGDSGGRRDCRPEAYVLQDHGAKADHRQVPVVNRYGGPWQIRGQAEHGPKRRLRRQPESDRVSGMS